MKRINKGKAIDEWENFRNKHPQKEYKDLKSDGEIALKRNLREVLLKEQGYICAYCSSSIEMKKNGDGKAVNEHILPQSSYPDLSMNYNNIVASCNRKYSCTNKKKNIYSELLISPLQEDCEDFFVYHNNGNIAGVGERGKYTVDLLGLNSFKLTQTRKAIYKSCEAMNDKELVKESYIEAREGKYPPHCDMVKYFYDRGFFDEECN